MIPTDPAPYCGFCGKTFTNWTDRMADVGEHFKKGSQIADWWRLRKDTTKDFIGMLPGIQCTYNLKDPVDCLICGARLDDPESS